MNSHKGGSAGAPEREFPSYLSFTLTNRCNLRCRMCGQWSEEGYMRAASARSRRELDLADWKRLVDEAAAHGTACILLRGGEPFLFPGILELLEHIRSKGIFASLDTNGTLLERYAGDLLRIGGIHITISVDGPEEIHDSVRGVKGCFRKIQEGVGRLLAFERETGREISKSACFTISPYSCRGLGSLPGVVRSLGIKKVLIVPYYYIPEAVGRAYEDVLAEQFGCRAYSWRGFHHEDSGVDPGIFRRQYAAFQQSLQGLETEPYMPLTLEEYLAWFRDPVAPVGKQTCANVERLIDIQPDGDADFCVDFPDYTFGNIRRASMADLWNSPEAARFRAYRREQPLGVCHRCGAKYMGESVL